MTSESLCSLFGTQISGTASVQDFLNAFGIFLHISAPKTSLSCLLI